MGGIQAYGVTSTFSLTQFLVFFLKMNLFLLDMMWSGNDAHKCDAWRDSLKLILLMLKSVVDQFSIVVPPEVPVLKVILTSYMLAMDEVRTYQVS